MAAAADSERPERIEDRLDRVGASVASPKSPTLAAVHETANQIADAIFDRAKPPDPAKRVRKGEKRKRTR